jgi:acyl carrier protein
MTTTPLDFIISYLEKKGELPQDKTALQGCRYLDLGLVSSFEIINFIMELEDEFSISFTPEDTQSDQFRIIGGVATMITEKQAGN